MKRRTLITAVSLLLLTGCVGTPAATPTPTPSVEQSPVIVTTPVSTRTYEITCTQVINGAVQRVSFVSPENAWAYSGPISLSSCEAKSGGGPYSDRQKAAAAAAGYTDVASVKTLYALCAQTDGYYVQPDTILSVGQMKEIEGMLTLCPHFPRADELQARIAASNAEWEAVEAGRIFNSGTKIIGRDIQPGTYVIQQSLENCYWERLDSAGNIIENNFISAQTRVEVTVLASDYAFNSKGCGKWVAQ